MLLTIAVFPRGAAAEKRLGGHAAIAGSMFLKEFVVTLDFKNKIVILEQ